MPAATRPTRARTPPARDPANQTSMCTAGSQPLEVQRVRRRTGVGQVERQLVRGHQGTSRSSAACSRSRGQSAGGGALDRARRDADLVADLSLRELGVVAQHDHLTLAFGEDRQLLQHGDAGHALLRVPATGLVGDDVGGALVGRASAPPVVGEVDQAPPGVRLRAAAMDARPHRVGPYESFLYEVLGEGAVTGEQVGDVDEAALAAQHELVKAGIAVASHPSPPHQRLQRSGLRSVLCWSKIGAHRSPGLA